MDEIVTLRFVPSDDDPGMQFSFEKGWLDGLDGETVEDIHEMIRDKAPGRKLHVWNLQPAREHAVPLTSPEALRHTLDWIKKAFG